MDLSNDNIIHVKQGEVEYLQFKELLKYSDKVQHAYSLKPLQFSDKNKIAPINYKKICEVLDIDSDKIIKSAQKHTDIVKDIKEYTIDILDQITRMDIEEYLEYCSYYVKDGKEYMNDERGKARKLASLRSFYNYFFRNELIEKNPAALVPMPKLHEKEIIRLEADEVALLLDEVESGENLTKQQLYYHQKTKVRDIALLTLLLGTGIRVSECVGIDLQDIDFKNNGIKIRRKGGYEAVIYFGEEVETALLDYLEQRNHIIPAEGNENALFLSLQNKRISVRAVEKLVKKICFSCNKPEKNNTS